MTMYRHLLQTVMPLTSGMVAKSAEHLTVVLKRTSRPCALTGVRRHSGMTYSQWHYLRKAAVCSRTLPHTQCERRHSQVAASFPSSSPTPQCPERVREVCEKYHSQLKAGQLKADDTVTFTTALRSAVYSSLSVLPWLHSENHIIAYMQILMNGKTNELLTEPLYSCSHFQSMYNHIDATVTEIPGQDCPSVLLSLIYSGLEQTDPLVAKLLSRCNDAVSEMSIPQLRDSAHVMQSLGNRDFIFSEKLVARLNELLTDSRHTDASQFEIKDLCVSSPVLAAYMSQELLEKCIAAMLLKAEQQYPHLDIVTVGFCFRYSRKMGFRADRQNLHKLSTLAKGALDRFSDYEQLQSHHIAEVCHNAKRLGLYTGPVVERMQQRSLQLLRESPDTLHIREITNLMFAFKRDISPEVKQELCELLLRTVGDADVLTLSNIADNLLELDMADPALMTLFQSKVRHNISNIAMFITRLVKVLRLLRERLDHDASFNQQMCETLLRLLNRRQGYDPTFVVVVTQFILPNVRSVMPAVLMECLMNIIPRCNLSLMLLILNGLDKMRGTALSRSLHNQVLQLRSQIQQNIGEQLENTTYASQLAELIRGLHVRSQTRDFVLLDSMMSHLPRLTKAMSRHDYMRTVQVLKHLSHPYYSPDVFEDLISFAKGHYSQVTFFGVLDLVNILAQAGYRPQDFEDFSTFVVQVLDDAVSEGNTLGQVALAHYLSLMQIFPDHVLSHIFTFPFLEQLDTLIEAEPSRQMFLKSLMMQLNRCAILECPHLDVPWFHADFCRQLVSTSQGREFQKNAAFVEEVDSALREVMRGGECVGTRVHSPYFHPIDFEIVFDANGEAIPTSTLKRINPDDFGFRRLALKLIGNQQLCANSHRRRGTYLRDRRHLEILGYRVEEITRYDWNSMALSDWGSKVNHVRNKIFHSPSTSPASKDPRPHPAAGSSTMHPYWK